MAIDQSALLELLEKPTGPRGRRPLADSRLGIPPPGCAIELATSRVSAPRELLAKLLSNNLQRLESEHLRARKESNPQPTG